MRYRQQTSQYHRFLPTAAKLAPKTCSRNKRRQYHRNINSSHRHHANFTNLLDFSPLTCNTTKRCQTMARFQRSAHSCVPKVSGLANESLIPCGWAAFCFGIKKRHGDFVDKVAVPLIFSGVFVAKWLLLGICSASLTVVSNDRHPL